MLGTMEHLSEPEDRSGSKCGGINTIVSLQYTWELVVLTGL
jgi:hypothetical protein